MKDAPITNNQLLRYIEDKLSGGMNIPTHDNEAFTYIGSGALSDDLISTWVFKNGSTTVGTLTFTYVGSTNNIATITRT